MLTRILDCPKCRHRFEYGNDGAIPETIACPMCGESSAREAYSALMLCPNCGKKLSIPLELLEEPELQCPHCQQEFSTAGSSYISELSGETTLSGLDRQTLQGSDLLAEGEIFDKFRIVRLLGRGGMAEVYLAEHILLKRTCALKLLTGLQTDPVQQQRFVREARIAHEIDHPGLVKVFDVGADPRTGRLFIAMEYVDGSDLARLARQKPFTEPELWEVLQSMTGVLRVLEEKKIVHRDIKPSNIMRKADGTLKLMDLGIAKAVTNEQSGELTLTMAQSVMGTPGFASPEQSQSSRDTDTRSDIFSLGATLYFLACGQYPFDGNTAIEIILNVMNTEPEPLEKRRPDLSVKFVELVRKMMAKSPAGRPQNTEELRKLIDRDESPKWLRMLRKTGSALRRLLPQKNGRIQWVRLCFAGAAAACALGILHYQMSLSEAVPQALKKPPYTELTGRTIDFRKQEVESRLADFRNREDSEYNRKCVQFCEEQIRELARQQECLRQIREVKARGYTDLVNDTTRSALAVASGGVSSLTKEMQQELIRNLNSGNLDPNLAISWGKSSVPLLRIAIMRGGNGNELVDALLQCHADVNIALSGRGSIYEKLCFSGRENVDCIGGESPVLKLVNESADRSYPVRSLTASKPDPEQRSAAERIGKFLLLDPDVNAAMKNDEKSSGWTLMHYAAEHDLPDLALKLIACGFRLEQKIDAGTGRTPYAAALYSGSEAVAKILEYYRQNTGVSAADQTQFAFHSAIRKRELDRIPELLKAGANPYTLDKNKDNVMQSACRTGDCALVEKLLKCSVSPNLVEKGYRYGSMEYMPLGIAVIRGDLKMFQLLLDHQADYRVSHMIRMSSHTYYHTADLALPMQIIYFFRKDPKAAIPYLEVLMQHGWKTDDPANGYWTALRVAATCSPVNPELVRFLLQKGAVLPADWQRWGPIQPEIRRVLTENLKSAAEKRPPAAGMLVSWPEKITPGDLPKAEELFYPLHPESDGSYVLTSLDAAKSPLQALTLRRVYAPPFTIHAVCSVQLSNVRFRLCGGELIFNWERNHKDLRLDIPGIKSVEIQNADGSVPCRRWVEFRISVTPDRMEIYADGKLRQTVRGTFSAGPVGIYTCCGSQLKVRSFAVKSGPGGIGESLSMTVNTDQDKEDPADGVTSLREAVNYAGMLWNVPAIDFQRDMTIRLAKPLTVSRNLAIDGGKLKVKLSGPAKEPVFTLSGKLALTLKNLELQSNFPGTEAGIVHVKENQAVHLFGVTDSGSTDGLNWRVTGTHALLYLSGQSRLHRMEVSSQGSLRLLTPDVELSGVTVHADSPAARSFMIMQAGTADNVWISGSGIFYVRSSALARNVTIQSGAHLGVQGGQIRDFTVGPGGDCAYRSGARMSGRITLSGPMNRAGRISQFSLDPQSEIVFDLTQLQPSEKTLISDLKRFSGAKALEIRAGKDQPAGTYALCGNAAGVPAVFTLRIADRAYPKALKAGRTFYAGSFRYRLSVTKKNILELTITRR